MKRTLLCGLLPLLLLTAADSPPKTRGLTDSEKIQVKDIQLRLAELRANKAELQVQWNTVTDQERQQQQALAALTEKLKPADCPLCRLQADLTWLEPPAPAKPPAAVKPEAPAPAKVKP